METLYSILDWPGTKWLFVVLAFVMPVASLLTWAERRQSAMMQDRLGPNRANIGPIKLWGILHFVADALKMIKKEDFIPANAHKQLFGMAPVLALAPVLVAFAIVPFGPTIYPEFFGTALPALLPEGTPSIRLQMFAPDYGILFYFAILSIANFGATIAGWASYNKWALLGGLRASSQMMSYEVAMGLSLMGVFLVMGTLDPGAMVEWQGTHTWGIVVQPVAFFLFFTAAIAETKRGPFDLPEGEPEIIGYFVEYSGMRWGMFFLAEFIEIVFVAMILTTVFFGGYHVPFMDADGVFRAFGLESTWQATHGMVVVLQLVTFGLKTLFFCSLQLAIRWTLPRFRADQLMELGWKKLLPLALVNLMVTALVLLFTM
ncbi:complex I subunit 1/NuoH family protein [Haliangium ochraceum]|uniref:NADH-quinone oxidoreductase subunit H n=1 Tax=Haliangium ochraceum (strain DSM 14365 / JCM 11303 / SMP-2) TaxID=502025 RepID=D0LPX2_HALO1|nr:complex I subunit 1 family protein [Haliangium ochraceum]ACY17009.1 NADH dehydrogenase (quinone) [Haliangium ochraceum DSM 14365]